MLVSRRIFLSKEIIAASVNIPESERKIIVDFETFNEKIKKYYQDTFSALSKIERSKGSVVVPGAEDNEKEQKEYVEKMQENLAGLIFYLSGVVLETNEHKKFIEINFAKAYKNIAIGYCDSINNLLEDDELTKVLFEADDKKTLNRLVSELKKDIEKVAEGISSASIVERSKSDENKIWDEYTIEYKKDDEVSSNDEMFDDAIMALRDFITTGKRSELSLALPPKVSGAMDNVCRRLAIYERGKTEEAKDHFVQVATNFLRGHIEEEEMRAGKELYAEFRRILTAIIRYGRGN